MDREKKFTPENDPPMEATCPEQPVVPTTPLDESVTIGTLAMRQVAASIVITQAENQRREHQSSLSSFNANSSNSMQPNASQSRRRSQEKNSRTKRDVGDKTDSMSARVAKVDSKTQKEGETMLDVRDAGLRPSIKSHSTAESFDPLNPDTENDSAIAPALRSNQRLEPTPGAQRISGLGFVERISSIDTQGQESTTTGAAATTMEVTEEPLIQAEIIRPDSPPELAHAERMEEGTESKLILALQKEKVRRRKSFVMLFVVLVVGLVIGISFGFASQRRVTIIDSPTVSPTSRGSSISFVEQFSQSLPDLLSQRSMDGLNDPNSPQSRALLWIKSLPIHENMSPNRLLQRFVLACLYYATDGTTWKENRSWLTNEDECNWYTASNQSICFQDRMVNLNLEDNLLQNSIPDDDIALLSSLQIINFANNMLEGTFPDSLVALSNLTEMYLFSNFYEGTLPASIFHTLTNLEVLQVDYNLLSSTIPLQLYLSSKLVDFDGSHNSFQGSIATEIGLLSNLLWLQISNNKLTGTIPSEIGSLTSLIDFDLSFNSYQFNVGLPTWIGNLKNLEGLEISQNDEHVIPSSPIPSQIGMLTKLTRFSMDSVFADGTLPTELCLLTNLQFFSVSGNLLSGTLPANIGAMTSLKTFYVDNNLFSGAIPYSVGDLGNQLRVFILNSNNFTAPIPTTLGKLTTLTEMDLSNNNIFDTMPAEVCALTSNRGNLISANLLVDCADVTCTCCFDYNTVMPCSLS